MMLMKFSRCNKINVYVGTYAKSQRQVFAVKIGMVKLLISSLAFKISCVGMSDNNIMLVAMLQPGHDGKFKPQKV